MTGRGIHLVIQHESVEYYCLQSTGLSSGDSEEIKPDGVLSTQTQHFTRRQRCETTNYTMNYLTIIVAGVTKNKAPYSQ